ncbi:MAG TPA: flagellar basal-body rod protein FlgF [bacterium]|nr:flagellar basal-body rod protein FlgF [bacterium]
MNPQGIYTLVSGGKALEMQMDTVANNLANVDTVGYKQDQPTFKEVFARTMGVPQQSDEEVFAQPQFLPAYSGVGTTFVAPADMGKDYEPGHLMSTGNTLDLALTTRQGFFTVRTPQGERYTRDGSFRLDKDNQLVTTDGYPVLGKSGPLVLKGNEVTVAQDGTISVDGKPVGGFKVTAFPDPERLQKLGGNLFAPVDAANNPRVMEGVQMAQGYLESSNVNPVRELTRMIEANRAYTSMQKAVSSADEMNQRAISLAQV